VCIDHCEPDPDAPWGAAGADDLAYGIFTSGSTGRPKLVLVGHRQLAGYVKAIEAVLRPRPGEAYAWVSTPAADLGHTMIFPALATGGTLHLASQEEVLEPELLARRFHTARIDHLKLTPTHLAALLAEGDARLLPRRSLVVGGEPFPWTLWEAIERLRPTCAVFNHYGPTETTVGVLCQPVLDDRDRSICASVPLGAALAHADVRVLDAAGSPAAAFTVGEIVVSGPCVARGYLDRPEVDGGAFGTDPESGARLYATGDRGRMLPDGRIEFLGRRDDQVKVRGYRVELGELRAALLEDPRVGDAAVIAKNEDGAGTRLLAYVQLTAGAAATDASTLRAELRGRIPEALVPSSVVVLDRLPRTSNGKLDLAALRAAEAPAPVASGSPEGTPGSAQAQEDDVTTRVRAIWCELFGLESIGADADFHELGGHSLLALRLTSRLRRGFDVGISVKDVFASPTVAGQARAIRSLLDGSVSSREEARTPEDGEEGAAGDARQLAADLPDREHVFGLSPAQHAMLRAGLDPRQALRNTSQRSVELWGALQPALLEEALARVVGHHEALRTCFRWDARDAVQVVVPNASPEILVADWRGLRPAEQEARMDEHVRRERQRGFDLREAPLLRLALFRVAEERHWLSWFVHHIVSDRWSSEVLLADLLASYEAARIAAEPVPAFPPFRRYVEWLGTRDVGAAERYWRKRLRDFGTPTLGHLPRPSEVPGKEPAIAAAETFLGPTHARALEARARELRVTLGSLVHAAWARALQKFTGLEDVLFGTVFAGRPVDLEGVETTVGLFLNVLPVRVQGVPDASPTDQWLRALHEDLLGSLEFDFLSPYDMQAMTAVRGAAAAVESVLVHQGQNLQTLGARPGLLRTGRIWTPSGETPAPLLVEVEPEPDLHVRFAWHTDRFEERHALGLLDAMKESLVDLVERAPRARAAAPDTRRDTHTRRARHDT